MGMRCLQCGHEMMGTIVEDIQLDMCPNCGGVWLDDSELDGLIGSLVCPRCTRIMGLREVHGVEYDVCPSCGGVWLDRGELGRLVEREHPKPGRRSRLATFLDKSRTARNVMLAKSDDITRIGTDDPVVDEVFLIHSTGCLIAHATRRLKPDQDDEVLSAMLVAIQGFVHESFKDDADTSLREIAFGRRRMLIDRGRYVMLALVLGEEREATPEDVERIHAEMREVALAVETTYAEVLEEWDGMVERFRGARDIIARMFG
jgi:Zn-finger nucleic acid-binding protein